MSLQTLVRLFLIMGMYLQKMLNIDHQFQQPQICYLQSTQNVKIINERYESLMKI